MKKEIGRREFLKIVLGSAAAAGLSHFRFLNVGGATTAAAGDQCGLLQSADGCHPNFIPPIPDACLPTDLDGRDTCYPPEGDPDVCTQGEVDVCMPPGDTDECSVAGDPDNACAGPDSDTCSAQDPDLCWPDHNPDECLPGAGDEDICSHDSPDACAAPGDQDYECVEADICEAQDPDLCAPTERDGEGDDCYTAVGDPDYGSCNGPPFDACTPPSDPDLCNPMEDPDERVWRRNGEQFVPEPGSMALLASGLLGLAGYVASRWRTRDEAED